ncbi:hypothetical protein HYU07_06860 [Candidatus Woesearchaeota archaeon]|nr:hypothetical protein [Candidatus Woesearchaeota archaeon]
MGSNKQFKITFIIVALILAILFFFFGYIALYTITFMGLLLYTYMWITKKKKLQNLNWKEWLIFLIVLFVLIYSIKTFPVINMHYFFYISLVIFAIIGIVGLIKSVKTKEFPKEREEKFPLSLVIFLIIILLIPNIMLLIYGKPETMPQSLFIIAETVIFLIVIYLLVYLIIRMGIKHKK